MCSMLIGFGDWTTDVSQCRSWLTCLRASPLHLQVQRRRCGAAAAPAGAGERGAAAVQRGGVGAGLGQPGRRAGLLCAPGGGGTPGVSWRQDGKGGMQAAGCCGQPEQTEG